MKNVTSLLQQHRLRVAIIVVLLAIAVVACIATRTRAAPRHRPPRGHPPWRVPMGRPPAGRPPGPHRPHRAVAPSLAADAAGVAAPPPRPLSRARPRSQAVSRRSRWTSLRVATTRVSSSSRLAFPPRSRSVNRPAARGTFSRPTGLPGRPDGRAANGEAPRAGAGHLRLRMWHGYGHRPVVVE